MAAAGVGLSSFQQMAKANWISTRARSEETFVRTAWVFKLLLKGGSCDVFSLPIPITWLPSYLSYLTRV